MFTRIENVFIILIETTVCSKFNKNYTVDLSLVRLGITSFHSNFYFSNKFLPIDLLTVEDVTTYLLEPNNATMHQEVHL